VVGLLIGVERAQLCWCGRGTSSSTSSGWTVGIELSTRAKRFMASIVRRRSPLSRMRYWLEEQLQTEHSPASSRGASVDSGGREMGIPRRSTFYIAGGAGLGAISSGVIGVVTSADDGSRSAAAVYAATAAVGLISLLLGVYVASRRRALLVNVRREVSLASDSLVLGELTPRKMADLQRLREALILSGDRLDASQVSSVIHSALSRRRDNEAAPSLTLPTV
jgi:hypothetical protein